MADPIGKGIHGGITDNSILKMLLDAGNELRYGQTEDERQEDVRALRVPGVRDSAFTGPLKTFDPAAAERYTSAYRFGERFSPGPWMQNILHAISSGGRKSMHAIPAVAELFGVGEERPELEDAERLGMERGSNAWRDTVNSIIRKK